MKGKMFVIYDEKAGLYHPPTTFQSSAHARRAILQTAQDQRTEIANYPADFTVFEMASFDDSTGEVKLYEAKKSLGTVLEIKNAETKAMEAAQ